MIAVLGMAYAITAYLNCSLIQIKVSVLTIVSSAEHCLHGNNIFVITPVSQGFFFWRTNHDVSGAHTESCNQNDLYYVYK